MSEPTTHKDLVETECQCGSSPLAMVSWLYSDGEGERCQACGHPGHINVEEQGLEGPVAAWWYADECDEGCRHDELGLMPVNLDPGNSAMSRPAAVSSPARRTIDALRKLRKGVINQAHPDDFTHALLDYTIRLHEAAEAEQKYYRRFPRPTHPWVLIDDLRAALDADIAGLHGPANTTRQVRPATARRGGLRP